MNVYEYIDYQAFLRDTVARKKAANPRWSYAVWARQLGLKSPSTLIMLVNGQRNPGPKLAQSIAQYLGLKSDERKYFCELVSLAKAKDDLALSLQLMKGIEERNPNRGFRIIDRDTYQAIANWHYYAIRELVHLPDFEDRADWIADRLGNKISISQVREAVRALLDLKLLTRDAQGRLRPHADHCDTATDVKDEGIKQFHRGSLVRASEALEEVPIQEREISAVVFPMPMRHMPKAKALIRKFQVEMCKILEDKRDSDSVMQLEIAFFPLTKSPHALIQNDKETAVYDA